MKCEPQTSLMRFDWVLLAASVVGRSVLTFSFLVHLSRIKWPEVDASSGGEVGNGVSSFIVFSSW